MNRLQGVIRIGSKDGNSFSTVDYTAAANGSDPIAIFSPCRIDGLHNLFDSRLPFIANIGVKRDFLFFKQWEKVFFCILEKLVRDHDKGFLDFKIANRLW